MKKRITFLLITASTALSILFGPDQLIKCRTKLKLYNTVEEIPHNKVGLLLGTSKYATTGQINLFYQYRIDAAVSLFTQKKIDYILISGDNGLIEYNEPRTIRNDLIKAGIPSESIIMDYAGFRTWDSVIRAKKVFGETKFTIISQQFQNERAIFIGARNQMELIGFNAQDVSKTYGARTMLREKLARINLIFDIIINKQPKYLGSTIVIE
ncbi:MAG: ElyC/SanA/YdcF family protein [Salinivirgaceae bacterium]